MNDLPGFETVKESKPDGGLHESEPAPRLKTINRKQLLLRPIDVEALVPLDHEVRAIWEFTGHLDLTTYYEAIRAVEGRAGCTAFDPRLLLCLWIYAYSKGTGSAREISHLCDYDPAYQWLTGMEPVNYHTLADFRSSHKESLDRLFVEVLGIMSAEGLITLERVMHDGTKVKALAGSNSFRREERIREHLRAAEQQVQAPPDEGGGPQGAKGSGAGRQGKEGTHGARPSRTGEDQRDEAGRRKEGSEGEYDRPGCPHHETVGRRPCPCLQHPDIDRRRRGSHHRRGGKPTSR